MSQPAMESLPSPALLPLWRGLFGSALATAKRFSRCARPAEDLRSRHAMLGASFGEAFRARKSRRSSAI